MDMTEWIDVQDELPSSDEDVLTYCPEIYAVDFWTGEAWDSMDDVTHWMPLPERPD